jgi:TonB family protein
MSQYLNCRDLVVLFLVTTLLLYGCSSERVAFEGNPMPEKQVAAYITPVTPSSAYDTLPKFLTGYAPFFPAREAKTRHWGYALVEFNVTTDGTTSDVRPVTATAYSFARAATIAVQKWRFAPARKHGQPVVVRMRQPFTFRS